MTFDLARFHRAQAREFDRALAELHAGRKCTHWIWFVFPQLAGMARSPMAQTYGLQGVDEASAYLLDPLLRSHLLAAANAVRQHLDRNPPARVREVMGSDIDALKLVSSMTLFREVARRSGDDEVASVAEAILHTTRKQGFRECEFTISAVSSR